MSNPPRPSKARPARRTSPSCRNGVSSLLRLAQPAASRGTPSRGHDVTAWLARAAHVLTPLPAPVRPVRPSEFAPSQWLVGH